MTVSEPTPYLYQYLLRLFGVFVYCVYFCCVLQCVCVCVCVCMCENVCVCGVCLCVCLCVCVWLRGSEFVAQIILLSCCVKKGGIYVSVPTPSCVLIAAIFFFFLKTNTMLNLMQLKQNKKCNWGMCVTQVLEISASAEEWKKNGPALRSVRDSFNVRI